MHTYLYFLCVAGGPVRYVGITCDLKKRLAAHLAEARRGKRLNHRLHWIRGCNYAVEIHLVETVAQDESAAAERALIKSLRDLGTALTNGTDGGDGSPGWRASIETRAKMSAAAKKRAPATQEARARLSASQTLRHSDPIIKAKYLAAARRRPPASAETRAKIAAAARSISPETRLKMSLAAQARPPVSSATRAKMSAVRTGRKTGPRDATARANMAAGWLKRKGKSRLTTKGTTCS